VRRREFIRSVGGATATAADIADRAEALRAGLRDLGYVEGKNIVIEFRLTEDMEQLHEHAAELVG
jgi:putative ABC transport system substrate-binding protein